MSKRYLKRLVEAGVVVGYDDPRLPTLVAMKRRGYTPEAIKKFILATGLSRINSTVSIEMLEHFLREDLKLKTKRIMAVQNPLKVVITNYPEGKTEYLTVPNNVETEELGAREVPFSKRLYINRDDFCLTKPNKHYKRLAIGLKSGFSTLILLRRRRRFLTRMGTLSRYIALTIRKQKAEARRPEGKSTGLFILSRRRRRCRRSLICSSRW